MNFVHKTVCTQVNLKNLLTQTVLTTTVNYTTGTVAVTNAGTTVTGSSTVWTSSMVGRKIRFETQSEYYTISAVASNTSLTIDRAYTGTTISSDGEYTIFQLGYDMPRDYMPGKEKTVRYLNSPTCWAYIDWNTVAWADPAMETFETPFLYTIQKDYTYREPASGTHTMDSGSGTTTVVESGLAETTNDYYNNWVLVNTSQNDTSLITDYVGATTTLTNSPAITSQAENSTFYLIDKRHRLIPWPILDTAKGIFVLYFAIPTHLTDNYDVPDIPEEAGGEILLVSGTLALYYGKDAAAARWQGIYDRAFAELVKWNNKFTNSSFRKERYSTTNLGARVDVNIPYQIPSD